MTDEREEAMQEVSGQYHKLIGQSEGLDLAAALLIKAADDMPAWRYRLVAGYTDRALRRMVVEAELNQKKAEARQGIIRGLALGLIHADQADEILREADTEIEKGTA